MSEEEKSNQFLMPFKIFDEVNIVPHEVHGLESGKGWKIYAYSQELNLALLYKLRIVDDKSEYIYDKATVDQLKKWNPEIK